MSGDIIQYILLFFFLKRKQITAKTKENKSPQKQTNVDSMTFFLAEISDGITNKSSGQLGHHQHRSFVVKKEYAAMRQKKGSEPRNLQCRMTFCWKIGSVTSTPRSCLFSITDKNQQTWNKFTSRKTNMDTQNDGLERMTPLKYGYFWYQFVRFLGCTDWYIYLHEPLVFLWEM